MKLMYALGTPWIRRICGGVSLVAVVGAFLVRWQQDGGTIWPPSVPLLVLALAAASPQVLHWVQQAADARDRTQQTRRAQGWANTTGEWPLVRELDPTALGARPAVVDVPYLERDAEAGAVELLKAGQPVLVTGRAMAGKSRMCANILQTHFKDRVLLQPEPTEFSGFVASDLPEGAVVWLNDLNLYLVDDDVRADWLARLRGGGRAVLATMRTAEWERYQPKDELQLPHSSAITEFGLGLVPLTFDADERERLAAEMPDSAMAAKVQRYGLGEYLGGAPLFEARYRTGMDNHPRGVALVRAAVDLRRVGLDPIDRALVERLSVHYLHPHTLRASEAIDQAWSWALETVQGLPGLIEPTNSVGGSEGATVRAGDFITDHIPDGGLPEPIWQDLLELSTSAEQAALVGRYAASWGRTVLAVARFRQAAEYQETALGPDHPDTLTSRNNLAYGYESAGDLARAIPLYEQTVADRERVLGPDHPDTQSSRNNLAAAYESAGDLARAIPLLEKTLADCERVLGPNHPTTRVVRTNLRVAQSRTA